MCSPLYQTLISILEFTTNLLTFYSKTQNIIRWNVFFRLYNIIIGKS